MTGGDLLIEVGEAIAGAAQGGVGRCIAIRLRAGGRLCHAPPAALDGVQRVPARRDHLAGAATRSRPWGAVDDRELDVAHMDGLVEGGQECLQRPLGLFEPGEDRGAVLLPHGGRAIEREDDLRVLLAEVEDLLARRCRRVPAAAGVRIAARGGNAGVRRRWRRHARREHDVLDAGHRAGAEPDRQEDEPCLRSHEDVTLAVTTRSLCSARAQHRRAADRGSARQPSCERLHLGETFAVRVSPQERLDLDPQGRDIPLREQSFNDGDVRLVAKQTVRKTLAVAPPGHDRLARLVKLVPQDPADDEPRVLCAGPMAL